MKTLYRSLKCTVPVLALCLMSTISLAQIPPTAVDADPGVISITRQGPGDPFPTGDILYTNDILRFDIANASTATGATGTIPANSLLITVSFNPNYNYQALVNTGDYQVLSTSGLNVFLTNSVSISPEQLVLPMYLRINATQPTNTPQGATVTCNVDRRVPITVANTTTANDNVSANFRVVALTLPISAISLTGTLSSNNVYLKWKTVTETNVQKFKIERSPDGTHFNDIDEKAAVGNTTGVTEYNSTDDISLLGQVTVLYYRIRVIDIDGKYNYSNIIAIKLAKNITVFAWPNPFDKQLNIQMNASSRGVAQVRCYGSSGQLVLVTEQKLEAGINSFPINTSALAKGIFIMEVRLNGEIALRSQFVKN